MSSEVSAEPLCSDASPHRRALERARRRRHFSTFSVRKRLRPPYTCASPVRCWCVRWNLSGAIEQQVVLRARHADVEQAALFFDELRLAGRELVREAAVDDVEQDTPCPTPCPWRSGSSTASRYSSSSERLAREIAGGIRRIERELREEALAIRILARQQLELIEIADARVEVFVQPLEVRPIPLAHLVHLALPLPLRVGEIRRCSSQVLRQVMLHRLRHGERASALRTSSPALCTSSMIFCALAGPKPGRSCSMRNAGDGVARVVRPAQHAHEVLDVRGFEELEPAVLHERNLALRAARLRARRCDSTCGRAPPACATARWLRGASALPCTMHSACTCRSSTVTSAGRTVPSPRIDSRCLRYWRGASAISAFDASSTSCVER